MAGRNVRVLVACEFSGIVRDAFIARGHDAWSNDLLQTESDPNRHIQGDCRDAIVSQMWDLIILHVPCTAMGTCGNKHYSAGKPKHAERIEAIKWSLEIWDLACSQSLRVALENPASVIFPHLRKRGADVQFIQPYQFGHREQKKTGLALYNLPRLVETNNVYAEMMKLPKNQRERIFFMPPSANRGHERSRFYTGFADAMASQWGSL